MARIKHGIDGPLQGKLGNHVGYIRKGVPCVRMRPHPSRKPRTVKQKARNMRFGVVSKFLSPLKNFINAGFKAAVEGTTRVAQNEAMSVNMKNAVQGEYPNLEMDYTKALVTQGVLPPALNPSLSYTLDGYYISIKFTWDPEALEYPRDRDQVMMAVYLPANNNAFYCLSGNRRSAGQDELLGTIQTKDWGSAKKDTVIETYIAFVSDDRESISDSVYVGRIELP